MPAISRLMYSETTVSDLVAVLLERDPRPLLELLHRELKPAASYEIRREDFSRSETSRNFQDVVFYEDSVPLAALELKVGAGWHGDQAARYEKWAQDTQVDPRLFFVTPLGIPYGESDMWRPLVLSDFLALWSGSSDELARALASEMEQESRRWTDQLPQRVLGHEASRTDRIMALRVVSNALLETAWAASVDLKAGHAFTINGPNPATYHWASHPNASVKDVLMEVDIRSGKDDNAPWQVRMGLEVSPEESPENDERLAHQMACDRALDLANDLLGSWSIEQIRSELVDAGLIEIAGSVLLPRSAGRPLGRKTNHEFYRDLGGRQRFVMFEIDPNKLEFRQVGDLITWGLTALRNRASALPPAGATTK